jgi:hypothetical protein
MKTYWLTVFLALLAGIAIGGAGGYFYFRKLTDNPAKDQAAIQNLSPSDVVKKLDMRKFLTTAVGPTRNNTVNFENVTGDALSVYENTCTATWFAPVDQRPAEKKPPVFDRLSQEVEKAITSNGGTITSRIDGTFCDRQVCDFQRYYRVEKDGKTNTGFFKVWCVAGDVTGVGENNPGGVVFTLFMTIKERGPGRGHSE